MSELSDEGMFAPGDVVRLKSGGPDMTIAYFHGKYVLGMGYGYLCEWITADGSPKNQLYRGWQLEPRDPPKPHQ